jgi:hypothetical protein
MVVLEFFKSCDVCPQKFHGGYEGLMEMPFWGILRWKGPHNGNCGLPLIDARQWETLQLFSDDFVGTTFFESSGKSSPQKFLL